MEWVMLHDVARQPKVDEASAENAMRVAIAWGWLKAEGISLYRVCLTAGGGLCPGLGDFCLKPFG